MKDNGNNKTGKTPNLQEYLGEAKNFLASRRRELRFAQGVRLAKSVIRPKQKRSTTLGDNR